MGPDLRVSWSEVCANPNDFEKLVKLLLVRLYPRGDVIDGRGGDGGREFQVRTSHSLEVWEAKSFTGRVSGRNPNRRRQVEDSLKSAGRLQPDAWHLVVPIDHDTSELAWFDDLRATDYPYIDRWRGQSWLESQLAGQPDLLRYATQNRLLEYVREYKLEHEVPTSARDVARRYANVSNLANELSPDWGIVQWRDADGRVVNEFVPKHRDAIRDAPISFGLRIEIPEADDTEELRASIEHSMNFGTAVEIPEQYVNIAHVIAPAELGIGEASQLRSGPLSLESRPVTGDLVQFAVSAHKPESATPIVLVPLPTAERTTGIRGGIEVTAHDLSRTLKLTTSILGDTYTVTLEGDQVPGKPEDLLPALRLLLALVPPNEMHVHLRLGESADTLIYPVTAPIGVRKNLPEFINFLDDLVALQQTLHQYVVVPDTVSDSLMDRVRRARQLIDGEAVQWFRGPLRAQLLPGRIAEFGASVGLGRLTGQLCLSHDDHLLQIGDQLLHLGPVYMTGSATIDLDQVPTIAASDEPVLMTFEISNDGWMWAHRGVMPGLPDVGDDTTPPGHGRVLFAPDDGSGP